MFRNIIFDFDGTLVDGSSGLIKYSKIALDELGIKYNPLKLTNKISLCAAGEIPDLLEVTDGRGLLGRAYERLTELRLSNISDGMVVYPGISELLGLLKNDGRKIFIATGKREAALRQVLKAFGMDFFDDFCGFEFMTGGKSKLDIIKYFISKYNLNESDTVMIGDTLRDVINGNKAGVKTIGCGYGYGGDILEIKKAADYYAEKSTDLKKILLGAKNGFLG